MGVLGPPFVIAWGAGVVSNQPFESGRLGAGNSSTETSSRACERLKGSSSSAAPKTRSSPLTTHEPPAVSSEHDT